MIKLRSIRGALEAESELLQFNPDSTTWLVSDLKTKLDINRRLLTDRKFLNSESVLRASELWKTLLSRVRPDLQVVSREFSLTMIADQISNLDLPWAQAPGVAQAAYRYIGQLMPILAHPEGAEMMKAWFELNPAASERWGRWYELSTIVWKEFLEAGYIAPTWTSGALVNENKLHEVWDRPLVVDLGVELNQVEADLLLLLGDHLDITVLRPDPLWAKDYAKCLVAYEVLAHKLGIDREVSNHAGAVNSRDRNPVASTVSYRKFTTMIAEVKDAVAQARIWVDAGTELSDIAIVAPDIELYWPALESFLNEEGLPTQKDRVRRLHGFADIAQWLAHLRLRSGAYNEADIELALFAPGSGSQLVSYSRFKTLYAMVYGREDLERSESVAKRFQIELDPTLRCSRDDFVAWSLKQLPESANLDRVEMTFKKIFAECSPGLSWPVKRWLSYLEQIVSKTEYRVLDGDPNGLSCIKLTSAENSKAKKMVVMGLTEVALRHSVETTLLASDLWLLAKDYGFHLISDDQAKLEFEASWLVDGGGREVVLTVPETDFNGSALAPSWLWLKGARSSGQAKSVIVPRVTRWDELQRANASAVAQNRDWSTDDLMRLERAFNEDFNEAELEKFAQSMVQKVSASGIEDYLNCPFIFAVKRLFGLSDEAELDLEIDPSRRGSLMHKMFEIVTEEPRRFNLSDEELGATVDLAREKAKIELADPRLWPPLRARHIDLLKRFLAFEHDNHLHFPDAKVAGRELEIAGFIRPSTGEFLSEKEPDAIAFNGRIDRIDEDSQDRVAVYDYKSSGGSVKQFGGWLKNNKIQLLLYSLAIEKGLTNLKPREVVAAIYYIARPLSRDKGFLVEGVDQGLFEIVNRRKQNNITVEKKEALFREGEALVKVALKGMSEGLFAPKPRDPNMCGKCRWSAICRTPHLNS